MVLCAGKTVRRTISCPEPPRTKTLHEGCGCYSSPDTGERYDSDKKSQRTLVKFVDNRQFLCYKKTSDMEEGLFFMPEIAEVRAAKAGQKRRDRR